MNAREGLTISRAFVIRLGLGLRLCGNWCPRSRVDPFWRCSVKPSTDGIKGIEMSNVFGVQQNS